MAAVAKPEEEWATAEEIRTSLRWIKEPEWESRIRRALASGRRFWHRVRAETLQRTGLPSTRVTTEPREISSGDNANLPEAVSGLRFYLYLIPGLHGRRIVEFEVHATAASEYAANLPGRTALADDLH